ncbi:CAP domain-containing protein [Whalleya microplaca]|nr:CAP domain-containing protein [Whalleya microplaca]
MIVPNLYLPHGKYSSSVLALIHLSLVTRLVSCQTIVVTVGPTIPSTAPEFVDGATFTSAILNSTNAYRAAYNASALTWNKTLEAFASDYLNITQSQSQSQARSSQPQSESHLQEPRDDEDPNCNFAHSGGPYGENLALGCSNATSCVQAWGNEVSQYDFGNPGFGEATGHFTQLVWKTTTTVGCGRRLCPRAAGWYLVCEYWPRGNVIGAFAEDVSGPVNEGEGMGVGVGLRAGGTGWVALIVAVVGAVLW